MQSQLIDRPVTSPEVNSPAGACTYSRRAVVASNGAVMFCVDARCIVGCLHVEKLTRLPGSHQRTTGVLIFRGRPVPLVSLGRGTLKCHNHRRKTEEHALVVRARGKEFALRVDGVPRIIDGPLPYESYAGRPCLMRTRHLERFFDLCVLPGNEATYRSRVPDCGRAA